MGLTAAAHPARADHTSAHFTLVSNVAATDNVFAAPDGTARESDIFAQVRPGVLLAYETPRMVQELTAEVELLDFVRNHDDLSVNYHAGYRGRYEPTPRTTLTFLANGTTGQLGQLAARTTPDQTGVALTPPGKVDVRQGDGSELLAYQLTQEWRLLQTAAVRYSDSNDHVSQEVTSYDTSASVGLERAWRADAITLDAGLSLLHLERLAQGTSPASVDRLDRQLNPHLNLSWRHDLDKHWSTSASGGLVVLNPYGVDPFNPTDTTRTVQLFPVVSGLLAYSDDWGRATLTAGRAVAPNLFIAQNTVADTVVAQAVVPLWFARRRRTDPQYIGAVSLGYGRTELIDTAGGGSLGTFAIYRGDVGIAYQPTPGLSYGVRYEYFKQVADASAAALFGSNSRSTIFATLSWRFPAQITVDVPRRTQSNRADGSDLAPVGEEVVVPDEDPSDKRGQGGGGNQGGAGTSGMSGSSGGDD